MNRIILIGRLTKDPDVRVTSTQKGVTSFILAVDRYTGSDKKETDFIPVVTWGKIARVCGDNLSKGQRVLVEGRLEIGKYTASDGSTRYSTKVVASMVRFLSPKKKDAPAQMPYDEAVSFADVELPF